MIRYLFIFLLILILIPNIEGFEINSVRDIPIDDRVYLPISDKKSSPEHENLLSNYFVLYRPEYEHRQGVISNIRDKMGIDSHHYLFESPHLKNPDIHNEEVLDYIQNKDYTGFFDRPITYRDETKKKDFLNKLESKDNKIIQDPFDFPYRDPSSNQTLGNKIVYDFSDSLDFDMELREREQRLRGYRRPVLDSQNDYITMSTCMNVKEGGKKYDCSELGLYYNHDANLKLARDDEYSHSICCLSP